jgi:DNA-binding NarL/FixJ family response regulator
MEALRILIADDHPAGRILLRNIPETVPEAENGSSAVALATSLHPDIIVMDLVMPEVNGLEGTRQVLIFNQKVRVILTTRHEFPSFVDEARRAGACGCFFQAESGRHLIPAVRVAIKCREFFTPDDLEGVKPH